MNWRESSLLYLLLEVIKNINKVKFSWKKKNISFSMFFNIWWIIIVYGELDSNKIIFLGLNVNFLIKNKGSSLI
jgi:hypothetical protein